MMSSECCLFPSSSSLHLPLPLPPQLPPSPKRDSWRIARAQWSNKKGGGARLGPRQGGGGEPRSGPEERRKSGGWLLREFSLLVTCFCFCFPLFPPSPPPLLFLSEGTIFSSEKTRRFCATAEFVPIIGSWLSSPPSVQQCYCRSNL